MKLNECPFTKTSTLYLHYISQADSCFSKDSSFLPITARLALLWPTTFKMSKLKVPYLCCHSTVISVLHIFHTPSPPRHRCPSIKPSDQKSHQVISLLSHRLQQRLQEDISFRLKVPNHHHSLLVISFLPQSRHQFCSVNDKPLSYFKYYLLHWSLVCPVQIYCMLCYWCAPSWTMS